MARAKKRHDWDQTSLLCQHVAVGLGTKREGGGKWQLSDFYPPWLWTEPEPEETEVTEDLEEFGRALGWIE